MTQEELPLAKAKKPHKVMKQHELFALGDYLRQVCRQVNGFAVYDPGFDDAKIAEKMCCTVHNVAGLRKNLIGDMAGKQPALTPLNLLRRIEALEAWAAGRKFDRFERKD